MRTSSFRRLTNAEAERGYEILVETVAWLREKQIQLWETPLPRAIYFARQNRGENFGVFEGEELVCVVSLLPEVPTYWRDLVPEADVFWLSTLATSPAHKGERWGEKCVELALDWAREEGKTVYLDCAPGFLADFYAKLGFEKLETRDLELSHVAPHSQFEAVLMKHPLK